MAVALNVAAGAQATMAIGSAVIAGSALVAKKAMSLFDMEIAVPDTDTSRQSTVKNTSEPQKIIYGEALVSGPISFIGLGGTNNEDLYQTIVLAGHQVNAITDIYFDDFVITNSQISNGSAAGGAVAQGEFAPQNNVNFVTIYKKLGLPSQTADSMLEYQFSNYTSNHRGDGIAYLAMKWTLNEDSAAVWDKYAPGNVKALVQGKKIYDPRLEETAVGTLGQDVTNTNYIAYSDNPALCLADYLTSVSYINAGSFVTNTDYRIEVIGTTDFTAIGASSNTVGLTFTATGVGSGTGKASVPSFGMGVLPSKIDWSAVKTAANGCDATVTVPNGNEKRFTCNGVVFATDTHKKNINKILSSMNGTLVYSNGRYVIRAGIYTAPTVSLNEDDLIGAISVKTSIDRSERVNTVKGLFIDPSQGHKMVEFPVVQLANELARDNYQVMEKETQFSMTNTSYGAQRLAYKIIKAGNEQKVITFPANYSALRITAGDRVQVTLSELNWTNKIFICAGWVFSEDGGIALTLREDSTAAYADPTSYSQVSGTGTITDAFRGVPSPSGLQVESAESKIFLNWVNPGRPTDFNTIEIWASSSNNRANAVKIGETNGTQFTHDDSNTAITITVGQTLYYWIRAKKNLGTATDTSALSEFFPTGATSGTSVTVNAAAVDWDNVADPTIGIDINNDTISINTGVANTTTGQTVATSGIEAGTTVTQGGITMNQGGSIKGGQSAYNTGTGFFLGYDSSAYKFSIGNASNEALTFDGSNLAVTGAITASSGSFTGSVSVSNTGAIYGGTMDEFLKANTSGFFLGYDTNAYKLSVGDSSGEVLTWDGSKLNLEANTVSFSTGGEQDYSSESRYTTSQKSASVVLANNSSYFLFDNRRQDLAFPDFIVSYYLGPLTSGTQSSQANARNGIMDSIQVELFYADASTGTPGTWTSFRSVTAGSWYTDTGLGAMFSNFRVKDSGTYVASLDTRNGILDDYPTIAPFGKQIDGTSVPVGLVDNDYFINIPLSKNTFVFPKGRYFIKVVITVTDGSLSPYPATGSPTATERRVSIPNASSFVHPDFGQAVFVGGAHTTIFTDNNRDNETLIKGGSVYLMSKEGANADDSDSTAIFFGGRGTTGGTPNSAYGPLHGLYFFNDRDSIGSGSGILGSIGNPNFAMYVPYDGSKLTFEGDANFLNGLYINGVAVNAGAVTGPAGSDTQIQYNDGGSLGASANLTFNDSTNTLTVQNLTVSGTTTTVDTDNLTVKDNNITLNYSTGDSSSTANNAGITIQDAVDSTTDASILWKTASDTFEFSHPITVTGITGYAGTLYYEDNRTIAPNELTGSRLRFGFTSWDNDNTSPYADFLHMRSYFDSSGGSDNLITFKKSGIGMRIWQQSFGSSTAYANYEDVWHTGTLTTTNKSNYDTAYTYSQVGHLPLAGGTLTGGLLGVTADLYSAIGSADNIRTGLRHHDTSAMAAGVGGQLVLGYKYSGNVYTEGAIIKMYKENGTSGHYGSGLKFQVRNTLALLSTKMTLDPSGNLSAIGSMTSNGILSEEIVRSKRDIRSAGQIRATGWRNDVASTDYDGLAFEIGVSSSQAFAISYDRDTDTYGPMQFNATSFTFNNPIKMLSTTFVDTSRNVTASNVTASSLTVNGNIQQNYAAEIRGKDSGGSVRTMLRISNDTYQIGWSGAGDVEFMGGGSYTKRMGIDGSTGVVSVTTTMLSTKAQHTTATSTNAHFRVLPSATTDTTGLSSLFLATSVADSYGVSVNGARKGGDGTPTFAIRMHNNSTSGAEVLTIASNGALATVGTIRANSTGVNTHASVSATWTTGVGMYMDYHPNLATGYIDNSYDRSAGYDYGNLEIRQKVSGSMTTRLRFDNNTQSAKFFVPIRMESGNNLLLYTSSGHLRGYLEAVETGGGTTAGLVIATSGGEAITFKDGGIGGTKNVEITGAGNLNLLHSLYSNSTQVLDTSRNLLNIGSITSTQINSYNAIGSADNHRDGIRSYDTTTYAQGVGGQIVLGYKYDNVGTYTEGAIIRSYKEDATNGTYGSGLKFQVRNHGYNLSTKMTLDPSGNLSTVGHITGGALQVGSTTVITSSLNLENIVNSYISNVVSAGNVISGFQSYTPTGSVIGGLRAYGGNNAYVSASDESGRTAFFGVDNSNYAMFGALTNHATVIRANNSEKLRIQTDGVINIAANGTLAMNGTQVISAGRNLTNVGTYNGYYPTQAAASSYTNSVYSADTRSTNDTPSSRNRGLYVDFKTQSVIGLTGSGTYAGVLTFRSYGSNTDLSGGPPIQIAYDHNGALQTRAGNGASAWHSWKTIHLSGNSLGASTIYASDIVRTQRDIYSAGQVRATGWIQDAASTDYTGLGFEIGVSSSTAFALSYNRDTNAYGPMQFNATGFTFNNQINCTFIVASNTITSTSAIGSNDNVRTGLAHYDNTYSAAGVGGQIVLGYKYSGNVYTEGAIIKMYKENGTLGQYGSGLKFQVRNHGYGLSTKLTLDPSGNLVATGNMTAYSDERLKDNIKTLDGSKVLQMRGVSFTRDGEVGSGVIAQELEQIASELVHTSDDEMGTKSVAYGNLVGYLIENAKHQQSEIDELKALVKKLMEK